MKLILAISLTVGVLGAQAALAEKLVDPATVAPEFRAAAETRRAEQLKQIECGKKAQEEKILPRERTTFLLKCIEN
jgi:hypothetical protein